VPHSVELKRPRTPRRITVTAVTETLRVVVAEHPGRADRRATDGLPARYIDAGKPNCLVAMVLVRLGYSAGILKALDQEHPTGELTQPGVRVAESRHPALRKIDPVARRLLQYVQDAQDQGRRWDAILTDSCTPSRWFPARDRTRKPWLSTR